MSERWSQLRSRARLQLRLLRHHLVSHTVTIDGHDLHIPPGVLDPILFRSGAWFGRQLARRVAGGERLLDMGCGSGVVGVLCQQAGARVICSDLNPNAVQAARRNGILDARSGDLFSSLPGHRFDHIAFNPPYFPGCSRRRMYGMALYGGRRLGVMQRFLDQLPHHLANGGRGWMVLSDRAPAGQKLVTVAGWRQVTVERVDDEVLSLWSTSRTG
ncbi:MAG: methyltransferase [Myxococcota bacterium]